MWRGLSAHGKPAADVQGQGLGPAGMAGYGRRIPRLSRGRGSECASRRSRAVAQQRVFAAVTTAGAVALESRHKIRGGSREMLT